jgi:nucleoid-associated protein YgaU
MPTATVAPARARSVDPGTVVVPEINTTIVARGDNLWRISRRIYGEGLRYTVIYDANQRQIRSPNLIYPGQLFVLPSEQPRDAAQ